MDTHIALVKELLASGLTQQALGGLLGKSQAWVGAVLAGKFSDIKWSDGEELRRLHAERFPPPESIICAVASATQSGRLAADRHDDDRREPALGASEPLQEAA